MVSAFFNNGVFDVLRVSSILVEIERQRTSRAYHTLWLALRRVGRRYDKGWNSAGVS